MESQRTFNDQLHWMSPTLAGQLHFGVISWGSLFDSGSCFVQAGFQLTM